MGYLIINHLRLEVLFKFNVEESFNINFTKFKLKYILNNRFFLLYVI